MRWFRCSLLLFVRGSLISAGLASAQAPAAQEQAIEAPRPKQTLSPESALSEARHLSKEGKFDESIAKLQALALKDPELKGLAHELGVTYYKKSDYLKATASFKKALEEDPGDNEAVQLMGLS